MKKMAKHLYHSLAMASDSPLSGFLIDRLRHALNANCTQFVPTCASGKWKIRDWGYCWCFRDFV